jgi:hypothetical protein
VALDRELLEVGELRLGFREQRFGGEQRAEAGLLERIGEGPRGVLVEAGRIGECRAERDLALEPRAHARCDRLLRCRGGAPLPQRDRVRDHAREVGRALEEAHRVRLAELLAQRLDLRAGAVLAGRDVHEVLGPGRRGVEQEDQAPLGAERAERGPVLGLRDRPLIRVRRLVRHVPVALREEAHVEVARRQVQRGLAGDVAQALRQGARAVGDVLLHADDLVAQLAQAPGDLLAMVLQVLERRREIDPCHLLPR